MQSNSDTRAMNVRLCILGIVLAVLGVVGYVGVKLGDARVKKVAKWPSVAGQIVTSEMSTATVKTGPVRRTSPIAKIRYSYYVDGKRYESDGLRVVPMFHSKPEGTPEELVARYPVRRTVAVYYDPADPKDAQLTPAPAEDARKLIRTLTFLGAFVGFIGLLMAIIGAMHILKDQRAAQTASFAAENPSAETPLGQSLVPSGPATPVQPRATHWLLRGVATTFGLIFLLFGSLVSVTAFRTPSPSATAARQISMLVIFGGLALFGGYLVYAGMRKPRTGTLAKTPVL